MSTSLTLADLVGKARVLLERLEQSTSAPKSVAIEHDAYWTVDPNAAVDLAREPHPQVGSLADDLERLDWKLEAVTGLELEALASLLRYYARQM